MISASASPLAADELERLLSESVDAARERAASAFDKVAESSDAPIVLFGAGGIGKRTAQALNAIGRPPIAFADNNIERAGTTLEGIPILRTEDAIARYGGDAVFVVTVWRNPATELMSDRESRLREIGAKRVTSFVTLSWKYPEQLLPYYSMDLPHYVLEASDEVRRGFALLVDERSRQEFVAHLRLRLHADFAGLPKPVVEPQYFPSDLFHVRNDEQFVDCGAYDGDTLKSMLRVVSGFAGRASAFEPDRANFAKLEQWTNRLPSPLRERVAVFQLGVGARKERVSFNDGGGTGAAIGSGNSVIDVVALDEMLGDMQPSFIKVDVEGYEPDVLQGARRLIEAHAPILALSSYHRQDHLWRLPLMAASMHSDYTFVLRSYYLDGWELVLYAVPKNRRIDRA